MSSTAAISASEAGPAPKCRPGWTISRTPYSPFVENATAPVPWNAGRCGVCRVVWLVRSRPSIPSDLVGIECTNALDGASTDGGADRYPLDFEGRGRVGMEWFVERGLVGRPEAGVASPRRNHVPVVI